MSYAINRAWSDQFLPEIRRIVGPHLLVPSPLEVDREQAADLIVLRARDMAVAARVRRCGYADEYPYDVYFTVRSRLDNGCKTEMAKLMEGWGDWMFYGHAGLAPGSVDRWWLIDLHLWRERLLREGFAQGWKHLAKQQSNGDGTHFLAFDLRAFKPSILIAGSHGVPLAEAV